MVCPFVGANTHHDRMTNDVSVGVAGLVLVTMLRCRCACAHLGSGGRWVCETTLSGRRAGRWWPERVLINGTPASAGREFECLRSAVQAPLMLPTATVEVRCTRGRC
jgi:hypothetical protein